MPAGYLDEALFSMLISACTDLVKGSMGPCSLLLRACRSDPLSLSGLMLAEKSVSLWLCHYLVGCIAVTGLS